MHAKNMSCNKNQIQLGGEDDFLQITTAESKIWQQHHTNFDPPHDALNAHSCGCVPGTLKSSQALLLEKRFKFEQLSKSKDKSVEF